jgi:integrase
MIAIATSKTASARINTPTWRDGWTTKTGQEKKGFWQVRHEGRYVSLAKYGAPEVKGGRRELALAVEARDKFLAEVKETEAKRELAEKIQRAEVVTLWHVCDLYRRCKLPEASPEYRQKAERLLLCLCSGHEGGKGIKPYRGWGRLPAEDFHEGIFAEWASHHSWGASGIAGASRPLKAAFAYAASHDVNGIAATGRIRPLISSDPLKNLKSKNAPAREHVFEVEEEKKFREAAKSNPDLLTLVAALIELGPRPSELTKLQLRHFDSKNGQFVLSASEWKNGKKTNRPRCIGLSQKWIEWAQKRAKEMGEGDYFFHDGNGKKWQRSRINKDFAAIRKSANLPAHLTPYTLRHSFITRAVVAGQQLKAIADQCGTSVGMIEKVYNKSLKVVEFRASVVNAVASAYTA